MISPSSKRFRATSGNILVVTMTTIALVGGFVGMAVTLTGNVSRNVQRSFAMRQAANIADAATETSFGAWRAVCITNSATLAPNGDAFDGSALPTPNPSLFPSIKKYTLSNYSVKAADATWNPITSLTTVPPKVFGTTDTNFSHYYIASADVTVPTLTSANATDPTDPGNVTVRARRIFEKRRTTLGGDMFNYIHDLEIHPGADMVVTGSVHTNGSLYTGHSQLSLFGNTTYAGTWAIGFKPGDLQHPEKPTSPVWGTLPVHQEQAKVPYGVDSDDYHRLLESTSSSDPLNPYSFAKETSVTGGTTYGAGVQIYIDEAGAFSVKNSKGEDTATSSVTADQNLYNVIKNALGVTTGAVSRSTITDVREGITTGNNQVRMVNFDVGQITTAVASGVISLSNPVIYISDTSVALNNPSQPYNANTNPYNPAKKRAIRLMNGARLPVNGLTVASSNPVYIQGDYNSGRTSSVDPSSNANSNPDFTNPTVSGYDRKPAAIIADAINVLSNNWSDANLSNPLANRTASNTTVNAAFIAGIVPTTNPDYSGGAENYPRFLESWGGKNFTYYGSMNQLFLSQQAVGRWKNTGTGFGIYNAPGRRWFFDTNFLSTPPPGMPYTVDYRRSRWYTE